MAGLIVKFGGAVLADGKKILRAARCVKKEIEKGKKVVVVVSAMGDTTDQLISLSREATDGKITAAELDAIMGMGEVISARLFSAALRSLGLKSTAITPENQEWPIITDSTPGNAGVNLQETRKRVKRFLEPMLERGEIPVVCGFLGKDASGRLTTLGRGGSDITAFVLSQCLKAETIIVTNVDGIMSADPSSVKGAKLLPTITVEELRDLARFGMGKMHPRALNFKDPALRARIINIRHSDLSAKGTEIVGPTQASASVRLHENPLTMVTVVGENMQTTPGILYKAASPLSRRGINIFGVSIGPRSFSIYVDEKQGEEAQRALHQVVLREKHMKSVTKTGRLALIVCESEKFIDTPGMIAKLTQPLAEKGINIVEMMTSRASISFLLDWEDRKRGVEILKKVMREIGEV
ncbi:MAG: aspartate kinase [Candidatus Hadarchaeales archaeon]